MFVHAHGVATVYSNMKPPCCHEAMKPDPSLNNYH